jgi:hypothetical protein
LTVGFRPRLVVVSSLFGGNPFDGGILGFHGATSYHEALSQTLPLSRWNSGYQEAFHTNFSFFMMEFWLLRSLFTNFSFTRWNLGYHEAFSRIFLSHDGISAITKPFHEFFFHTMEFTRCTNWGKTLFIYITKSIYTGPASLKTLSLDLESPLQGKEYGPPYSN